MSKASSIPAQPRSWPLRFCLPLWRVLPLIWKREGVVVPLLPFPRVALEFFRLKSASIADAQRYVEDLLNTGAAA